LKKFRKSKTEPLKGPPKIQKFNWGSNAPKLEKRPPTKLHTDSRNIFKNLKSQKLNLKKAPQKLGPKNPKA
jgi:hypothetical protein